MASFSFLSFPEKTNKGGVIGGVIIGFILVSILIGVIGYFICGKKRSELFSHRRLYDDTRNDPGKEQQKGFTWEHCYTPAQSCLSNLLLLNC